MAHLRACGCNSLEYLGGHIVDGHAADTRLEPAVKQLLGRARPKRGVRLDVHRHHLAAVQVELAPVA